MALGSVPPCPARAQRFPQAWCSGHVPRGAVSERPGAPAAEPAEAVHSSLGQRGGGAGNEAAIAPFLRPAGSPGSPGTAGAARAGPAAAWPRHPPTLRPRGWLREPQRHRGWKTPLAPSRATSQPPLAGEGGQRRGAVVRREPRRTRWRIPGTGNEREGKRIRSTGGGAGGVGRAGEAARSPGSARRALAVKEAEDGAGRPGRSSPVRAPPAQPRP
ncbi:uncharacterized protein LOC131087028 [Melospiza georgiana]|uniref:uncharacterized protein LOC131087028 n=1 Tax=Melospiza georgiana TaxID=44398 RepID=UPI0025AC1B27|nr:uncharacterized protein LOC131087028 [Melospiza georgiana]